MLKKVPTFLLLAFSLITTNVFIFAKDKPTEDVKPTFTAEEKSPVLVLQRDAMMAQADALPKQIYADQAAHRAHDAWLKLLKDKGVDQAKWSCNELTFECNPIPQPKAEEVKPETQEKK